MRCTCLSLIAALLAAAFSGCSGDGISATASYNPGYGPFDQNGNYVEAWADKPAKKHWWSRSSSPTPAPTPPRIKEAPPSVASTTRPSGPPRVVNSPAARPRLVRPNTRPVSMPRPTPTPPPVAAAPTPAAVAATPPPPKPRPKTVAQPKPKPKPTPKPKPVPVVRHTVSKGDTLYSLGRRYGVSVSAIQRANGLSGSTIRLGQTLKIPK